MALAAALALVPGSRSYEAPENPGGWLAVLGKAGGHFGVENRFKIGVVFGAVLGAFSGPKTD